MNFKKMVKKAVVWYCETAAMAYETDK